VASADIVQRPAVVRDANLAHPLLEDGTLNYHGIAGNTFFAIEFCRYVI
jgi:hypothetical protein